MKRLIFLFLAAGWLAASAGPGDRYRFGVKGGLSIAKTTNGIVKSGSKTSLTGGLWLQLKLNKSWTAQAEVLYIEKGTGGINHNNRTPKVGEYTIVLMYAEVPVLFQYHFKDLWLEAGPGLGVLTYEREVLVGTPSPDLTRSYPFVKREFSFNAGLGHPLSERWSLGLRFTHSLLPVRQEIAGISKPIYNRVLTVTTACQLLPKKKKAKAPPAGE